MRPSSGSRRYEASTHASALAGFEGVLSDRRLQAALWLALLVVAFVGVLGHALWGGNDTRQAGMVWDMYRHGNWVAPTIDGRPYLEKPPLSHWTALVMCTVAGHVSEGLVRLPSALYGLGTLVLVVLFLSDRAGGPADAGPGRRRLAAWAAAFMCATAAQFYEYSRVALTDMSLTFVVALSLYVFWRVWLRPTRVRWLLFLLVGAASFYAKGLIGPALVWSTAATFLVLKRRLRLLAGLALAYVPILLAVVGPWVLALYRFAGWAGVRFVFWDNQVGRFLHFSDASLPHDPFFVNKEPLTYYLVHLPPYLAPWPLLLVPALAAWCRRRSPYRGDFHLFVSSAIAGMFLVLHASSAKVANYALPVYPFLFMVVGVWVADAATRTRLSRMELWCSRGTAWVAGGLVALAPVAVGVAEVVRPDVVGVPWSAGGTGTSLATFAALGMVAFAGLAARRRLVGVARPVVVGLAPAVFALAMSGVVLLVTPLVDAKRSLKAFTDVTMSEARSGHEIAFGGDDYSDLGAFTFYLDRRLPILERSTDIASYLDSPSPRAVIVGVDKLGAVEARLGDVPHLQRVAGEPDTVAGSFVLLENRPELWLEARRQRQQQVPLAHPNGKTGRN